MRRFQAALAMGLVIIAGAPGASGQGAAVQPGDQLFGQGDFDGAATAYAKTLSADPKDAGALAGLARVRLYQGRLDEAAQLARQALAVAPADPVGQAVSQQVQLRKDAFGPDRYRIEAPAGETVIRFLATDPLPIVEVMVNGRPAHFFIDTGAPNIAVDRDFARELGLEVARAGEGVFAGGRRAPVERTMVSELQLGPIKIANVPAMVGQSRRFPLRPGVQMDGIIGTGLLEHFLSTLDYCDGALVLRPRGASAGFQRAARAAGANIVPIWLVPDHFTFARARLNKGRQGLFYIDTGMTGGGLSASKATLDDAGVVVDPASARTGLGGGGATTIIPIRASATLGALTVEDVPGFYMPEGDPGRGFPFPAAGILSHMFFRHSRLTFDFEAMKLVTQSCPADA